MKRPCFDIHRINRWWLLVLPAAFLLTFCLMTSADADETGEELYRQGRYAEAEQQFLKQDMDNPLDAKFRYNRGCAAYGNEDFQGASAAFQSVLARSEDPDMKRRSVYNLGNAAFQSKQFDKAAAAYKRALTLDPNDADARHNLEMALHSLREAQKQQEQQNDSEQQDSKDSSETSKPKDSQQEDKGGEKKQNPDQQKDADSKEAGKPQADSEAQKENEPSHKEEPAKGDKPSPQEESGRAKADGSENVPENQKEEKAAVPMDAKMAEALLDNVEENRKPYYLFQARGNAARSGKDW